MKVFDNTLIKCVFIFILTLLVYACSKDKSMPIDLGYEYFPLKEGAWIIYDCDSTIYGVDKVIKKFQIKEEIDSLFIDAAGFEAYKVNRYKRESSNDNWLLQDIWVSYLSLTAAERIEENQRKIKLKFPVKNDQAWNGNAKNSLGEEEYVIDSSHFQLLINDNQFDSVLTVTHAKSINVVQRFHRYEMYAKHVGLVYYNLDSLDIQNDLQTGKIDTSGVAFVMRLNNFMIPD